MKRHSGQFQPGYDPRRHVRKAEDGNNLPALARQQTLPALNKLVEIMMDESSSKRLQLEAATRLLDRGWGRPHTSVYVNPSDADPKDLNTEQIEQKLREYVASSE